MKSLLEQIIFLTYLTDYDIPTIYHCLNSKSNSADALAIQAFGRTKGLDENSLNTQVAKASAKTAEAIDKLKYHYITAITYTDRQYPLLLHDLKDKPPVLYLKGKLRKKSLAAVIGSREISDNASRMTVSIVDKLL